MIDVIWSGYHSPVRDTWAIDFLEDLLGYTNTRHHEYFADVRNAVVVVLGQDYQEIDRLNADLAPYNGVVFCLVGDEESLFDTSKLEHPNMKLWIQSRASSVSDRPSHRLPWGYTREARLQHYTAKEKSMDWFFSGQVTHSRRDQCVRALRGMSNGFLRETAAFSTGLPRNEYHRLLAKAKIAPCPAGFVTPDSFRVWEALEARCVPIVDGLSPRPEKCVTENWWTTLLGCEPPFPIVYDWNQLPEIMEQQLNEWPSNEIRINAWWQNYKNHLRNMLLADFAAVREAA